MDKQTFLKLKPIAKYGAPMGQASQLPLIGKVHLQRVPIDSGGYDPGGVYWGTSDYIRGVYALYCAWNDDCLHYVRAYDRNKAKEQLKQDFDDISFYLSLKGASIMSTKPVTLHVWHDTCDPTIGVYGDSATVTLEYVNDPPDPELVL